MRRHTELYDFTEGEPHGLGDDEFGGREAQTTADKFFMDREVLIRLKVDPRSKTFKSADIDIAYTFI
jgi:hypothetical protein